MKEGNTTIGSDINASTNFISMWEDITLTVGKDTCKTVYLETNTIELINATDYTTDELTVSLEKVNPIQTVVFDTAFPVVGNTLSY